MKFSIIIAAYNACLEIERALQSVLSQSFKDYEVIVVNDASIDNTAEIVSQYKTVKLLNNEKNRKAGGARNRGMEVAQGDYILFLDSDDCFTNHQVLAMLNQKIIEAKEEPDVIYMGLKSYNPAIEILPDSHNSQKRNRLLEWKYANVWDVCWNRKFLTSHNIKFIENRYFEDFPFYYEGILKSKTYQFLEYPTILYTKNRPDSMTTAFNMKKISDFYYNMTKLIELYLKADEEEQKILFEIIQKEHHNIEYFMLNMKKTTNQHD